MFKWMSYSFLLASCLCVQGLQAQPPIQEGSIYPNAPRPMVQNQRSYPVQAPQGPYGQPGQPYNQQGQPYNQSGQPYGQHRCPCGCGCSFNCDCGCQQGAPCRCQR